MLRLLALFALCLASVAISERALANAVSCEDYGALLDVLRQMSDEERLEWERLSQLDPIEGLRQMHGSSFPSADKVALVAVLTALASREIVTLFDAGNRRASRRKYRSLVQALNNLRLNEEVIDTLGHSYFTDAVFYPFLRTERFIGRKKYAKSFAGKLREAIKRRYMRDGLIEKDPDGYFRFYAIRSSDDWKRRLATLRREFVRPVAWRLVGIGLCLGIPGYFYSFADRGPEGLVDLERNINFARGWAQRIQGHESMGWGVYGKRDEIEAKLGAEYREARDQLQALRDRSASAYEIEEAEDMMIRVLVEKIYGDYIHYMQEDPNERYAIVDAALQFDEDTGFTGTDLQKTLMLSTLLEDVGIDARIEGGHVKRAGTFEKTVWVRLVAREVVIDPTRNFTGRSQTFYDRYEVDGPYTVVPEHNNLFNDFTLPNEE